MKLIGRFLCKDIIPPSILFSILVLSCLTLVTGTKSSVHLPGDSYNPVLVTIDPENAYLFFAHDFSNEDTILIGGPMQMSLIQGTWSEAFPIGLTPLDFGKGLASPPFSKSRDLYFVDDYDGIGLKTYINETWSTHQTLLTMNQVYRPPQELRVVCDARRHLHIIWEGRGLANLKNKSSSEIYGLFYSEFDGVITSIPEPVAGVEYDPSFLECSLCSRHFLGIDPTDRLYLAWFTGPTYFTARTQDGWMKPIHVEVVPYRETLMHPGTGTGADLLLLDFKVDSTGTLYFFYSVVSEGERLLIIKYKDGTFTQFDSSQPARLREVLGLPVKLFDVERDSTNTFHIAYMGQDATGAAHLYYQTFKDSFSVPIMVSEVDGSEVDLSVDTEDTPHIAWTRQLGHKEIFYTHLTEAGWQAPTQVTSASRIGTALPTSTITVPEVPSVAEALFFTGMILILSAQSKKKRK